jgi:hypothetical protein
VAVLVAAVDATSADATGVVLARHCEVNKNMLTYGADVDQQSEKDTVNAALKAIGIVPR